MTRTQKINFKIESGTHPGVTGKQNEDRYGSTLFLAGKKQVPCLLSVLCDGIGGHHAGEKAAEMGVAIITEAITSSDPTDPLTAIHTAVTKASETIFLTSQSDPKYASMGATCAIAWLIGDQLYTANLGDTRIYLLRGNQIIQLTTDHTWVQEAFDAGIINDDNIEDHPNAHVIRRYLGSKKPPDPDFRLWFFEGEQDADAIQNQGMQIKPGDVLLLCSDGLTDLVSDQEILEVVRSNPFSEVPGLLIDLANQRGGYDNTTIVLIQPQPGERKIKGSKKHHKITGWLIAAIIFLIILAALILGRSLLNGRLNQDPTPTQAASTHPTLLEASKTINPSVSPTLTTMRARPTEPADPRYTITPWPTHTPAP